MTGTQTKTGIDPSDPDRITVSALYDDLERRMRALVEDAGAVDRSRKQIDRALQSEAPLYGVNTGFGALARERIPAHHLIELQRNLLLSHAVGVGPPVPIEISRLMLRLKVAGLGLGFSGVSRPVFDGLMSLDRAGLVPWIPSKGSVGASGDLAPLAHMALPLLGIGSVWDQAGSGPTDSGEALAAAGLRPVELSPKDGLALINGTQFMSAYGAFVLEKACRLVRHADLIASMSLEALQGSIVPFDERIQAIRPHPGQREVAENVRALLEGSEILDAHRHCGKVQDPYSLRCVPQVHGAVRDGLRYASGVVEVEINSVTDNPLVFDDGDVLSGGNFHGQPLALALDTAAMAVAELGSIAERRIYLLLAGHDGLPALLMRETGLNSGFMIPQYTAAALVSENKVLTHPASVDSIPTSLGQEDHVSMGSVSAVKLLEVFRNVEHVLAIELLTAAQALDYRKPRRPGRGVEVAHGLVRERIRHREADYLFAEDLEPALEMLREGRLLTEVATAGVDLI